MSEHGLAQKIQTGSARPVNARPPQECAPMSEQSELRQHGAVFGTCAEQLIGAPDSDGPPEKPLTRSARQ